MADPCSALRLEGKVAAVVKVGADGARLDVRVAAAVPRVRPSQFFMVRPGAGAGPLLARPFSLYLRSPGADGDLFSFLLKVIGPGTRALAALETGSPVSLVGPLGNGFPKVARGERLACVAGGVGIATFPLVFEEAIASGADPNDLTLCFGAATESLLYEIDRYQRYGVRVRAATDDGSHGARGTALDLLRRECEGSAPPKWIFACGPERMLEAVAAYCRGRGLECHLSLETRMGCGTGVCNACAVPVRPAGNGGWPVAKACREGPVFRAGDLVLEEAHQL
jgi:dihydroorotate dehydrogenase electron transfer subunit